MPEEPDIIDEELADEEAEPEEGLSDESREAIQRGADRLVNGKKEVPSDKSQVASGQTETQAPPKEIPDNKKDDLGSKYGDNKQGKLPANKTPDGAKPDLPPKTAPTAGGANAAANKLPQAPPSGSGGGGASGAAGAAGKAGQALQAGRIGADIAAHPREGAEEAGHAVAHQAGKKVAKEAGEAGVKWAAKQGAKAGITGIKGLADLATSGTIIVPVIIEASDFIIGKMANLPGAKGAIGWINKHKILVTIFVIFLFLGGPVLAFVAGAGGAGDTGGSSGIYAGGGTGIPNGTAMVNGVVLYKQGSGAPWAGHSYGGGTTIASSGCGVTSIAMVLATYGIDVNPADIADYSLNHGFRVYGSGTSWGIFDPVAKNYGLPGAKSLGTNLDSIVAKLGEGYPVIASMSGPSKFTSRGHFIVLTGYDNGTFYINDPGGRNIAQATADEVRGALLNSWILEK